MTYIDVFGADGRVELIDQVAVEALPDRDGLTGLDITLQALRIDQIFDSRVLL